MHVVAGGHRGACAVVGVEKFGSEFLVHGAALLAPGGLENPADGQRLAALGIDGHRDLVVAATDALAANLDVGANIVDGRLEDLDGWNILYLFADLVECGVEDFLRDGLLTVPHHAVDELGSESAAVLGIWAKLLAGLGPFLKGHILFPFWCASFFGSHDAGEYSPDAIL